MEIELKFLVDEQLIKDKVFNDGYIKSMAEVGTEEPFYAFSIWIGLGVMWIYELLRKAMKPEIAASVASVAALAVPIQMASENWHDHDRSNRYTVSELAYNYLQTLDPNAILVTHGDNDTFPLWYAQEVEGVRTDVRVMNTSLMGMDWYIDQMQNRTYE